MTGRKGEINMSNPFTNTDAQNTDAQNTNEQNTEVMTVQRNDLATVDMLAQLTDPNGQFFCSIKDDGTRKSKVAILDRAIGEGLTKEVIFNKHPQEMRA